jgi:hypothetical protein
MRSDPEYLRNDTYQDMMARTAVLARQLHPALPPCVPAPWLQIIHSTWSHQPQERMPFSQVTTVLAAFLGLQNLEPVPAPIAAFATASDQEPRSACLTPRFLRRLQPSHEHNITAVSYALESDRLWVGQESGWVAVWDCTQLTRTFAFEASHTPITALCSNRMSQEVWVATESRLTAWGENTFKHGRKMKGHDFAIRHILLLDQAMFSLDEGGLLIKWDGISGKELARRAVGDGVVDVQVRKGLLWIGHSRSLTAILPRSVSPSITIATPVPTSTS